MPFSFTKPEVESNLHQVFEKVSKVKVFSRLEKQPNNVFHRSSSRIEVNIRFLLSSDFYDEVLEDCKTGDYVFYFPLMQKPIYMRFWEDDLSEAKRRKPNENHSKRKEEHQIILQTKKFLKF